MSRSLSLSVLHTRHSSVYTVCIFYVYVFERRANSFLLDSKFIGIGSCDKTIHILTVACSYLNTCILNELIFPMKCNVTTTFIQWNVCNYFEIDMSHFSSRICVIILMEIIFGLNCSLTFLFHLFESIVRSFSFSIQMFCMEMELKIWVAFECNKCAPNRSGSVFNSVFYLCVELWASFLNPRRLCFFMQSSAASYTAVDALC